MGRKVKVIIILVSILLTGCWDYIGLNEITIVTGMAIDKNFETQRYELTFEIIDLGTSAKDKSMETKTIESQGKTLFDAVRNAKQKLYNKLYFSNAQIAIINHEIVKKDGIKTIVDWFLRDAEIRETIDFAISNEKSAKELLLQKKTDTSSVAYTIKQIIDEDNNVTSTTNDSSLCNIINTLENNSMSLNLPMFTINKDENVAQLYGIAVFNKDKMIDKLTSEESKYYLFIVDELKGGIIPLKYEAKKNKTDIYNISLEISKSKTKKSYKYKDNKFTFTIDTDTEVYLGEYEKQNGVLSKSEIKDIEKMAAKHIEHKIKELINRVKQKQKIDIFSFSNLIYKKDYTLWKKISKNWNQIFIDSDIIVNANVDIHNTALVK